MATTPSGDTTYYVYTLAYPDGRVFYVGKGKGGRVDHHVRDARRGHQLPRHQVCREIEEAGGSVVATIVFDGLAEDEALRRENALIFTYTSAWLTNGNKGEYPTEPRQPRPEPPPGTPEARRLSLDVRRRLWASVVDQLLTPRISSAPEPPILPVDNIPSESVH